MPLMIGNRTDRVATTSGHSLNFEAGEATFVPEDARVIEACLQRGHTIKKEDPAVTAEPKVAPAAAAKK